MELQVDDIITATNAHVLSRGMDQPICAIAIDSRTIRPGQWFVAIKGPHFDGHDFCADVVAKGAAGLIVEKSSLVAGRWSSQLPLSVVGAQSSVTPSTEHRAPSTEHQPTSVWCLQVSDTVAALGAIAAHWRRRVSAVPCVAITGSNGKSTTKEMIASVTEARGPVCKTEGNFNNLIGLPLTVFRWADDHRTAVLELGMSAAGEIARLTRIVAPDVACITNVTAAHLEQLLTVENVAAAKGELFATMRPDGVVCVNMEDPLVRALGLRYPGRKITYGMRNACDVQFGRMSASALDHLDLTIYVQGMEHHLRLGVPGIHNVMNAMAAIAAGIALGIPVAEIFERLPRFQPMKMRMERVQLANGVQVVNDSYNANPVSMEAALRTVGTARRAGKLIAVLGDMLELGPDAAVAHRTLGGMVRAHGVQRLFVTGQYAATVAEGAVVAGLPAQHVQCIAAMSELQRAVAATLHSGDVVLVKGSRGMKMEQVVDYLKQECGTG